MRKLKLNKLIEKMEVKGVIKDEQDVIDFVKEVKEENKNNLEINSKLINSIKYARNETTI